MPACLLSLCPQASRQLLNEKHITIAAKKHSAVHIKRVYEPVDKGDGFRILVDRLWPRGIKKENAHLDVWLKEVAPSNTLRKWFHHEQPKWYEFTTRYHKELKDNAALDELKQFVKSHPVITLLYGARDEEHNQAAVLRDMLLTHSN